VKVIIVPTVRMLMSIVLTRFFIVAIIVFFYCLYFIYFNSPFGLRRFPDWREKLKCLSDTAKL